MPAPPPSTSRTRYRLRPPQSSRRPIPASIEEPSAAKPLSDVRRIRPAAWAPVVPTLTILSRLAQPTRRRPNGCTSTHPARSNRLARRATLRGLPHASFSAIPPRSPNVRPRESERPPTPPPSRRHSHSPRPNRSLRQPAQSTRPPPWRPLCPTSPCQPPAYAPLAPPPTALRPHALPPPARASPPFCPPSSAQLAAPSVAAAASPRSTTPLESSCLATLGPLPHPRPSMRPEPQPQPVPYVGPYSCDNYGRDCILASLIAMCAVHIDRITVHTGDGMSCDVVGVRSGAHQYSCIEYTIL